MDNFLDTLISIIITCGIGLVVAVGSMYLLAKSGMLDQILRLLNGSDESGIRGLGFYFFIFFALLGLGLLIGFLVSRLIRSK